MEKKQHIPVLKEAVIEAFKSTTGTLLDGTFGGGGHSEALLNLNSAIRIVAIDTDPEAQERAVPLQKKFPHRFSFIPLNFSELDRLECSFSGILFDLGVSSFQLDQAERGFSFRIAGPLDMRMNNQTGSTAKAFLETASETDLVKAIRDLGEEKQWRSVVKAIIRARGTSYLNNTLVFVNYLESQTPLSRSKKRSIHPATRVFQGIRMFINDELGHLEKALPKAFQALCPEGILAVISFHSLEDRMVKQFFNEKAGRSIGKNDSMPRQLKEKRAELLTHKPIRPNQNEIDTNPRCRSSKLRILKKLL